MGRDFPHLQTGPEAHQTPVQSLPGLSRGKVKPGRDADHSPLLVPMSKKSSPIPILSLRAFVACDRVIPTYNVMDARTDRNIFSTEQRGNGGPACSYCSTVTSLNPDLSSTLYHNIVQYFPTDSPLKKYSHLF